MKEVQSGDFEHTLERTETENEDEIGLQSEDTILVEDEPKILTFTGDFPVETVQLDGAQQERPAILVRRRL